MFCSGLFIPCSFNYVYTRFFFISNISLVPFLKLFHIFTPVINSVSGFAEYSAGYPGVRYPTNFIIGLFYYEAQWSRGGQAGTLPTDHFRDNFSHSFFYLLTLAIIFS